MKTDKLLESYDGYGDFDQELHFVYKYGVVPSKINFTVACKESKDKFEQVLATLRLEYLGMEIVYKKWKISSKKEAKDKEDYVNYILFTSTMKNINLSVYLKYGELEVDFFYDQEDESLESFVLEELNTLRNTFGKPIAPVFRVLTKCKEHKFCTEDIDIEFYDINLHDNYNDDFLEVDQVIQTSIEEQQSGLILLHGKPGTGKTSYIKYLTSKFSDEKFIFIPNDFVNELLKPYFITFLVQNRNAVLVIEDAEKVIMSRAGAGKESVVSTILQLTDGLFSDYLKIKVICTFNVDVSKIDKALFRKGRMIAFYEFRELSKEKTQKLLQSNEVNQINEGLTLAEIYHRKSKGYQPKEKAIGF